MTKKQTDEGWGDVTEREVALYSLYDLLNNWDVDAMVLESMKDCYPNLTWTDKQKKTFLNHVKKNVCRLQRVIVKSLEAYDYELKDCDSE